MNEVEKFSVFLPLWIAMAIGISLLLWKGSYEAKRKWAPRLMVLAGALLVGLIYWTQGVGKTLYMAVPAVAVITALNLRSMRFCPKCSAHQWQSTPFSNAKYCSKCGHDLEERVSDV